MTNDPYRFLNLQIRVDSTNPVTLTALDQWLQLGILSHAQVRELCRHYFSCPLPEPVEAVLPLSAPVSTSVAKTPAVASASVVSEPVIPSKPPSLVTRVLQSLMAELSVIWLLFLGVFLVIVSSGVLAASQWERFSATGQYLVLFAYTLAFAGVSLWSLKRPSLELTSKTLRLVTFLLIPVNFWAMDGLQLWRYPVGIAVAGGAAVLLIGLGKVLSGRQPLPLYLLGVSFLQWGWGIMGFPLIAVYLGVILALGDNYWQQQRLSRSYLFLGVYSLAILLIRAIFVAGVDVPQLGLAIALCGWLVDQLQLSHRNYARLIHRLGLGLLLIGWFVSVVSVPWQALAISGLGLVFFQRRLQRFWHRRDLTLLFLIGLQALWLVWRCVPEGIQGSAIAILTQLTQSENIPFALLGVVLFPYLWVMIAFRQWLQRQQKSNLVQYCESLALGFGVCLTILSYANPLLLTLNLLNSTLTLAYVYQQQPRIPLLYFTHTTGILTLIAGMNLLFPNLTAQHGGILLVGLALCEWSFAYFPFKQTNHYFPLWQKSGWYLGLIIASLSYLLILDKIPFEKFLWFAIPIALTNIATAYRPPITWLSIGALGFGQFLTLEHPETRLLGLILAVWLMLINTQKLPQLAPAVLTVGYCIGFTIARLQDTYPDFTGSGYLFLGTAIIAGLWIVRDALRQHQTPLAALYRQANDAWAIFGCSFIYSAVITLPYSELPIKPSFSPLEIGIGSSLLMLIVAYRSWQKPIHSLALGLSVVAIALSQLPVITLPDIRLLSLGLAVGLMVIQTRYLCRVDMAILTLTYGLGLIGLGIWDNLLNLPPLSLSGWLLLVASLGTILWLWRGFLLTRSTALAQVYTKAADSYGIALFSLLAVALTLRSVFVYWGGLPPEKIVLVIILLALGALVYRSQIWTFGEHSVESRANFTVSNTTFYSLGFGLELLAAEGLSFFGRSLLSLAVANIGLGLATQLLGDLWRRKAQKQLPPSLHILPLAYGGFGAFLRWGNFTSGTGLITLAIALIAVGVGRRRRSFQPLLYLGLLGISLALTELLLYQTWGFPPGDRSIALAGLLTAILYAYRSLSPFLVQGLHLTLEEVKKIAHLHGLASSLLTLTAIAYSVESSQLLIVGNGVLLIRYAIFQGRNHPNSKTGENWTYLGLFGAGIIGAYCLQVPLIKQTLESLPFSFVPWRAALGSLGACFLYFLPWNQWGWSAQPWKIGAVLLPIFMIYSTLIQGVESHPLSLLITAGYYGLLAVYSRQIQFTYFSLTLLNWMLFNQFIDFKWTNPLIWVIPPAISGLYIVQVEPSLQGRERKSYRHFLRLLGVSAINFVAFFTESWLIAGAISLLFVFLGLGLRIRAFLYVGTLTLLLNALHQLLILNSLYGFIKWIVLFIVGVSLISIAANFETRRSQIVAVVRSVQTQLQEWE